MATPTTEDLRSQSKSNWGPLRIQKRSSVSDGLGGASSASETEDADTVTVAPRRTSSSFKHVTKNSLVSSNPFKQADASSSSPGSSPSTTLLRKFPSVPTSRNGELGLGLVAPPPRRPVHARADSNEQNVSPVIDQGVASAPIGLGRPPFKPQTLHERRAAAKPAKPRSSTSYAAAEENMRVSSFHDTLTPTIEVPSRPVAPGPVTPPRIPGGVLASRRQLGGPRTPPTSCLDLAEMADFPNRDPAGPETPRRTVTFAEREDVLEFDVLSEATDSRRGSDASWTYGAADEGDQDDDDDEYEVDRYARQLVLDDYADEDPTLVRSGSMIDHAEEPRHHQTNVYTLPEHAHLSPYDSARVHPLPPRAQSPSPAVPSPQRSPVRTPTRMTEYLPSRSPSPTGSDSSRRPLPHLPELAPGTPLDSVEERSETSSPEIVFRPGASVARSTEDGGSDDSSEGVPKTPELHSDADMPAVTATRSTLAVDAAPYGLPDLRQSSPFMLDVASMALSRESSLDKRTVAAPRPNFITREALLGSRESTPTPADYDPPKRRSVVEASPEPEDLLGDTSTSSRADLKSVYSGGGTSPLERLGARMLFSPDPALDGQSPISGGDAFPSAVKPGSKLSSVEYATESEEEDGEDGTVDPPPLPPKVDKSAYEDAIMAKRRELRDREDGGERRRSRPRRSMSTGALPAMETERSQPPARPSSLAISASTFNMSFAEGLSTDLDSIRRSVDQSYRTHERQHGRVEYGDDALSSVTTVGSAGDVHSRAWRRVRSPADMQDKSMRHISKSARGVVYVRMKRLELHGVPIPHRDTAFQLVVSDGSAKVATPFNDRPLMALNELPEAWEFELGHTSKLRIEIGVRLRTDPQRDPHLRAPPTAPTLSRSETASTSKSGFRRFLGAPLSPKKPKARSESAASLVEPIAHALEPDGTLCRGGALFEELAAQEPHQLRLAQGSREIRLFDANRRHIGKLVVVMLHRPTPPESIDPKELPRSLNECLKHVGRLERIRKHAMTGTLTQMGADCPTWRRRCIELKDGQLLSRSEVTQQTYALIELSEVASVEDLNTRTPLATSETSETLADGGGGGSTSRRPTHRRMLSDTDEHEARLAVVERSFRLNFREGASPVDFYADSDADKAAWLRTLARALKDVPPRWAMAMRAREEHRMAASASGTTLTASATARSLSSPAEAQSRPKTPVPAIRRPPPPRA